MVVTNDSAKVDRFSGLRSVRNVLGVHVTRRAGILDRGATVHGPGLLDLAVTDYAEDTRVCSCRPLRVFKRRLRQFLQIVAGQHLSSFHRAAIAALAASTHKIG